MPNGMTRATMGANFRERRCLRNEFDYIAENVRFDGMNLESPRQHPNEARPNGWTPVDFSDVNTHQFPYVDPQNLSMICHGNWQIKMGSRYITSLSEKYVQEHLNDMLDWEDKDVLCSELPMDKIVFFRDILNEPANWDPLAFGVWFPRRLLFLTVPSLHSSQKKYRVIISYIPANQACPLNFQNRLGFVQDDTKKILGYACLSGDCKPGFRLMGCDSHVMSAIMLIGVFAHRQDLYHSTHRNVHLFDISNSDEQNINLFNN